MEVISKIRVGDEQVFHVEWEIPSTASIEYINYMLNQIRHVVRSAADRHDNPHVSWSILNAPLDVNIREP